MERFKGEFTYVLRFCVLGVSLRGGAGGQDFRTDFEITVIRPVNGIFISTEGFIK